MIVIQVLCLLLKFHSEYLRAVHETKRRDEAIEGGECRVAERACREQPDKVETSRVDHSDLADIVPPETLPILLPGSHPIDGDIAAMPQITQTRILVIELGDSVGGALALRQRY